ncbi:hypothetical protein Tco_0014090 [Tanacetum coccineum]
MLDVRDDKHKSAWHESSKYMFKTCRRSVCELRSACLFYDVSLVFRSLEEISSKDLQAIRAVFSRVVMKHVVLGKSAMSTRWSLSSLQDECMGEIIFNKITSTMKFLKAEYRAVKLSVFPQFLLESSPDWRRSKVNASPRFLILTWDDRCLYWVLLLLLCKIHVDIKNSFLLPKLTNLRKMEIHERSVSKRFGLKWRLL